MCIKKTIKNATIIVFKIRSYDNSAFRKSGFSELGLFRIVDFSAFSIIIAFGFMRGHLALFIKLTLNA